MSVIMAKLRSTAVFQPKPQALHCLTLAFIKFFCFIFFAEHDTMSYTILLRSFVKIANARANTDILASEKN
jgi:hypothetical protein